MTKAKYVDPEKLSITRREADAANEKAREAVKPWDLSMDHHDVDEATGKPFKVTKHLALSHVGPVYIDGKPAVAAYDRDGAIIAFTKRPKK